MSSLAILRTATRDIHERLHLHPAFAPLTASPADLTGYAHLLRQLHGFHAPVERFVFAAAERLLPELDDLPSRLKADRLLADIAAVSPEAAHQHPTMVLSGELTRPGVLGSLYVIEGATLGGRELGRRLAPMLGPLGLVEPAGRRFLLAYGDRHGAMWHRFCAVLDAIAGCFTAQEQAAMAAAARALFLRLEAWLSGDCCHAGGGG